MQDEATHKRIGEIFNTGSLRVGRGSNDRRSPYCGYDANRCISTSILNALEKMRLGSTRQMCSGAIFISSSAINTGGVMSKELTENDKILIAESPSKAILLKGLRDWYILIANVLAIYWLFAGLPKWQLQLVFLQAIDNHWFPRLLYLAFGWPIVYGIGGILIFSPI